MLLYQSLNVFTLEQHQFVLEPQCNVSTSYYHHKNNINNYLFLFIEELFQKGLEVLKVCKLTGELTAVVEYMYTPLLMVPLVRDFHFKASQGLQLERFS